MPHMSGWPCELALHLALMCCQPLRVRECRLPLHRRKHHKLGFALCRGNKLCQTNRRHFFNTPCSALDHTICNHREASHCQCGCIPQPQSVPRDTSSSGGYRLTLFKNMPLETSTNNQSVIATEKREVAHIFRRYSNLKRLVQNMSSMHR